MPFCCIQQSRQACTPGGSEGGLGQCEGVGGAEKPSGELLALSRMSAEGLGFAATRTSGPGALMRPSDLISLSTAKPLHKAEALKDSCDHPDSLQSSGCRFTVVLGRSEDGHQR